MPEKEVMSLVGDDSQIFTGSPGTVVTGDGTKSLDELAGGAVGDGKGAGIYIIKDIAASTFFPSGVKSGEAYPATGAEVLAVGDSLVELDLTHIADASGWSLQITQSEIDVTRLSDGFKKYRLGKRDASGTLNSIFTIGVSDRSGGTVSRTMKLFRRAADGTVTIHDVENKSLYFLGYVRKARTPGETEAFIFGQIYLYNLTLGGQTGSAQSYDSSMRLTGIDPVFYSVDIPLPGASA